MRKPSENSQVPESKWLTADDFEYIYFNLAREFFTFKEPIPDYGTRDKNLLESSLAISPGSLIGIILEEIEIKTRYC